MTPREIYNPDGEKIPEENLMGLKESVKRKRSFFTYWEKTPKFKEQKAKLAETLEKIDFETIKLILGKISEHSNIKKDINFIEEKGVTHNESFLDLATYSYLENIIRLNTLNILNASRLYDDLAHESVDRHPEFENDQEKNLFLLALITIIHEEVHAISNNEIYVWYKNKKSKELTDSEQPKSYTKVKSGYATFHNNPKNHKFINEESSGFEIFDEAVTQKLAVEVFEEYLRQKFIKCPAKIKDAFENLYADAQKLLEYIIKEIAEKSGMSPEVVWQAIIRSKLEGINLEDSEIKDFIDEQTFQGFIEKLKNLEDTNVKTLITELENN